MVVTIKTDRSRIESYQRCPRSRWLKYEIKQPGADIGGVVANKPAFALEIGKGFHKIMEVLLSAVIKHGRDQYGPFIEAAIAAGIESYDKAILPYFEQLQKSEKGLSEYYELPEGVEELEEEDEPFTPYTVGEGRALVEALGRGYVASSMGLRALLDEYEVLECEGEMDVPLEKCQGCRGHGQFNLASPIQDRLICQMCNGSGEGGIILMARPDGILRSRKDGQLYVLSFKTTGKWDKRKERAAAYDTEGISQLLAAEHKYGEKFAGVQMVYAAKGYKMQDKGDGLWKVHNGLVRPYLQKSKVTKDWAWESGELGELAYGWNYINEDGEPKTLGTTYHKINLWEYGSDSIRRWIDYIAEGRWIDGRVHAHLDLLDKMVIMQAPFYRDENSIEEWKIETAEQEREISQKAKILNDILKAGLDPATTRWDIRSQLPFSFRKHRHSCSYPSPCEFIPICHEGVDVETGMYKLREANHPQEKEG